MTGTWRDQPLEKVHVEMELVYEQFVVSVIITGGDAVGPHNRVPKIWGHVLNVKQKKCIRSSDLESLRKETTWKTLA